MCEVREYNIKDTDYYAVLSDGHQIIYDCDGEVVSSVPVEWGERELDIWGKAYTDGKKTGESQSESWGEYRAQRAMLKALGIGDRLNDIENSVKLLASVLYHHEGICKEDVAAMAGRG